MSNRVLGRVLQVLACVVAAAGVGLCVLQLAAAARSPKPAGGMPLEVLLVFVGPALMGLVAGLGLGGLLAGVAGVLLRPVEMPAGLAEGLGDVKQGLAGLHHDLRHAARAASVAAASPAASARVTEDTGPREIHSRQMDRMIELLEEMREVTMMSDDQRQQRLQLYMRHRKAATLQQTVRLVQQKNWAKAAAGLALLADQFPDDPDVARARQQLEEGRAAGQAAAFRTVQGEVEDLMSISSWDQALAAVQRFLADFPGHPQGEQLLARVSRERDLFRESTVQRLFDETRHEVERRNWRRALAAAQRLTERFPDHHRSQQIQQQLAVIQGNAEIEERQEQEARIQELIRSKRFREAIELGQDVMRRFPLSPQAEELEDLLPKLQELALQQEVETAQG